MTLSFLHSIEALKCTYIFVRLVCSGEVFSFQSCECARGVLHAVCSPPYRLHKEQPAHCQVRPKCASKLLLEPGFERLCNLDLRGCAEVSFSVMLQSFHFTSLCNLPRILWLINLKMHIVITH